MFLQKYTQTPKRCHFRTKKNRASKAPKRKQKDRLPVPSIFRCKLAVVVSGTGCRSQQKWHPKGWIWSQLRDPRSWEIRDPQLTIPKNFPDNSRKDFHIMGCPTTFFYMWHGILCDFHEFPMWEWFVSKLNPQTSIIKWCVVSLNFMSLHWKVAKNVKFRSSSWTMILLHS